MSTSKARWEARAEQYRQLQEYAERMAKSGAAPVERIDLKENVLALDPNDEAWVEVVTKHRLLDNILLLANRDMFDYICTEYDPDGIAAVGPYGEEGWVKYMYKVIRYLKYTGGFAGYTEGTYNNYEDTAGGCDETLCEAMYYIWDHPEWEPE